MTTLALMLNIVVASCLRLSVTATAYDMNGHMVTYSAPYWLCTGDARPVTRDPVMPVCFESGNPYLRVLYAHPALKPDVAWVCAAE